MMKMMCHFIAPGFGRMLLLTLTLTTYVLDAAETPTQTKKNVLFIIADDMRPEIGAYQEPGSEMNPRIQTPNLDALAGHSLLLRRSYSQFGMCSPSRSSFLTGRRPDSTHVYDLKKHFRDVGGDFTTLPQYFKENGYKTMGVGKIYHGDQRDPPSWTEDAYIPSGYTHEVKIRGNHTYKAYDKKSREQSPLPDEQVTNKTIEMLQQWASGGKTGEQPFFLAVGFYRPHLPFYFPEELLALYPESDITLAEHPYSPEGMPDIAWTDNHEIWSYYYDMRHYQNISKINTTLPDAVARTLRRGYYCSVSFVDWMVGRILQSVSDLGLRGNTVISFIGDHGLHLGEQAQWGKHTNFEAGTRVPSLLRIPGRTDGGKVSDAMAELVDFYPTLVEAAGLPPVPLCPQNNAQVALCTEGTSLLPLVESATSSVKSYSFSQYSRPDPPGQPQENIEVMGYSIRGPRYRYTEWLKWLGAPEYRADWEQVQGVELYDYQTDPGGTRNVIEEPQHQQLRAQLRQELRAGWRAAQTTKH